MFARVVALGLVSSLLVGGAAIAKKPPTDPNVKVVCKTEQRTGTRFGTKICRSAEQWDAIAEQSRRQAQEMAGPTVNTAKGN